MKTGLFANSSTDARADAGERLRGLPALRFDIDEAKYILRMSRAQLYNRIAEGAIAIQKDGARTYISLRELERYVEACEPRSRSVGNAISPSQGALQRDDRVASETRARTSEPGARGRARQLHR